MARFVSRHIGLVVVLGLVGCSKEVGRIPLAGAGSGTTTLTLAAGDVDFWTDIHLEYEGDAALAYTISASQGGAPVGTTQCDPLGPLHIKNNWTATNLGGKHTRRGSGKMACSITLPTGGPTTIETSIAFSRKPAIVTFDKADLVIKQ
jgi:hypothetical protein